MKLSAAQHELTLRPEDIDRCSALIRDFAAALNMSKREISRYAITAEEILLKTAETASPDTPVMLRTGTRLGRPSLTLSIQSEARNAFASRDAQQGVFGSQLLRGLGLSPDYVYAGGENVYTFRIKQKRLNPFFYLIAALAAALLVGFLGLLLPTAVRSSLLTQLLSPLHDTFLNILGCIAGPMVFLSVAWGIYGIGDAATLRQVGKNILLGYIGFLYIATVLIGWMCLPLFSLNFADGGGASNLSSVFTMILGIVPGNIFSPFVDGNTLQIIFLAIVIGIALLFLGKKTTSVAKAVEQINYIVQFLIEFISKLVPYFIFIVLVRMIWMDTFDVFLRVGKFFLIFLGSNLAMTVVLIGYTAIRHRVPPLLLIKKGLPALLIALTTGSSAAAFGTNMKACREEYGIDKSITSFGLPLGMVTFKPATSLAFTTISLFFAEIYGIPVDVNFFVILIFSAGTLALATPPIPGGALTAYTVLFSQLNIPVETLAVALACDTLLDFITTGLDQFLLPLMLLNRSSRLGMVDHAVLSRQSK